MKEILTAIITVLLFVLFVTFSYVNHQKHEVLRVITPVMIAVDLNKNHLEDKNEIVCIPQISSYTSHLSFYKDIIPSIPYETGIGIGYFADKFALKNLSGKSIKVSPTKKTSSECTYAEIYIDNTKYSDILKDSGFAIIATTPFNVDKFNSILEKVKALKLSIYNHKSNKYHKLNCKYGKIASDAVILEVRDLPKEALPCKYCHINKTKVSQKPDLNVPDMVTLGNLKLILTDFTKILKPDRNCNHNVCKELASLISNSKESIDIAMYGWSEIPKIKTAIDNAKTRGVKIRVVYDTNTYKRNYYPESKNFIDTINEKRSDKIPENTKLTNYLMHNKFMIIDNKIVYTGSMNFSTTGLSGFNHNSVLIINSPEITKYYSDEFEQMYNGKFHTLKEHKVHDEIKLSKDLTLQVCFSPHDKCMTNKVAKLVEKSSKYVYIPAFLITHKELTTSLIKAKNKGVDVRLILDATTIGTRNSSLKELRDANIPVKLENYAGKMHSKTIIIDDKYLVIGSANFSNSGENKNDENQIIIENSRLTKFYKDFFLYMWQKIPDKYLRFNPSAESKYSIGSCFDGLDNNYDGKIDSQDPKCK